MFSSDFSVRERFLLTQKYQIATASNIATTITPTAIPAFAPAERDDEECCDTEGEPCQMLSSGGVIAIRSTLLMAYDVKTACDNAKLLRS